MRQYRGKSIKTGKWHYGGLVGDGFSGWYICNINILGEIEKEKVDPKTVGQNVGEKDMNGKEIFEGDIVDLHGHGCEFDPVEQVKFMHGGFSPITYAGWEAVPDASEIEIVGNIHDNPELMKG